MHADVLKVVQRVPSWEGAQQVEITPLAGGITNRNYRIDVDGDSFVLRMGGERTELLGIDRQTEYAAAVTAARAGIAPAVITCLWPEGYLITRYIDGQPIPPAQMRQPATIARMAALLRRVHSLPPIPATFSPFRTVESYAAVARGLGVELPPAFAGWLTALHRCEAALGLEPSALGFCHNDLLNANFLHEGPAHGGRLWLLDWEYAGMGAVHFDLANFAVHHGFDDEQERQLVTAYFGTASGHHMARLKLLKIVSDCREALWSLVQFGISSLEFDFMGYAERHFGRMASQLDDARLPQWLAQASECGGPRRPDLGREPGRPGVDLHFFGAAGHPNPGPLPMGALPTHAGCAAEELDHTAEIGLRVRAPTAPALFACAAQAMFALAGIPGQPPPATSAEQVTVEAPDAESLLVAWLNELLYLYERTGLSWGECQIQSWSPTRLVATVSGTQPLQPPDLHIKAVTYHQLQVVESAGGWLAEIYFDI